MPETHNFLLVWRSSYEYSASFHNASAAFQIFPLQNLQFVPVMLLLLLLCAAAPMEVSDAGLAHPRFKLSHAIRHNGTFCRKYHMLTRKILLVNFVKNNSKVDPQMR